MEKKCKPYPTGEELDKQRESFVVKEPPAVYELENPLRYTYADYVSWMDDKRRELIDGVVYDMFGAPMSFHARISTTLSSFFHWFIRSRNGKCKVYHAPFDVRLPSNGETADNQIYTVVQPDICVICDSEKIDERGCIGVPDLIVEVQSPSTGKRDLQEKFTLYERSGVKEYWVVFPKEKKITVFLLQKNGLFDKGLTYEYDSKVPVSIFKGLEINLKELFEE
jgi:Uma2 family endonuclease